MPTAADVVVQIGTQPPQRDVRRIVRLEVRRLVARDVVLAEGRVEAGDPHAVLELRDARQRQVDFQVHAPTYTRLVSPEQAREVKQDTTRGRPYVSIIAQCQKARLMISPRSEFQSMLSLDAA